MPTSTWWRASMAADSLSPSEVQRWMRIGVLCALAMLLGYLESFIPIPIPGVKLGLANIPVLVALARHDIRGAFFVGLTKVLATSLLFGNPVTLAYAATGTLCAFALMAPLSLLPTMRLWMTSIVGALAHEAGQLLVAQVLLGTPLVWYGAPVLAVAGCVTGLLCGIAAERTAALLQTLPDAGEGTISPAHSHATGVDASSPTERPLRTGLLLTGYLLLVILVMHAHAIPTLAACLVVTLAACLVARLQPRILLATLGPTLPLALVTLVAQVATSQRGMVVASLGPIALTHEALAATAVMLLRLADVTYASIALVGLAGREGLAGAARAALRPLEGLGLRTQGPELAVSTAMRLVALIADELPDRVHLHTLASARFWTEELPTIVRDLYATLTDAEA